MNAEVRSPKFEVRSSNRTRINGVGCKMECALATIPEMAISFVRAVSSYIRSSYHVLRLANCFDLTAIRLLWSHNRSLAPNNHLLPHDNRIAISESHIVVASSGVPRLDHSLRAQSNSIAIVECGRSLAGNGTSSVDVGTCRMFYGTLKMDNHSNGTGYGSLTTVKGFGLEDGRSNQVSSVLRKIAECATQSYMHHSMAARASGCSMLMSDFIFITL